MIKYSVNILILSLLLFCSCNNKSSFIRYSLPVAENIEADLGDYKAIVVNESIELIINTKNISEGEELQLIIDQRFSSTIIPMIIKVNRASYLFSSTQGGLAKVYINYKGKTLDQTDLFIHPSKATDKAYCSNGPKSLVVNDDVSSMLVMIPKDEYGNPMLRGKEVKFTKQIPNEKTINKVKFVENLVAYEITGSLPKSGKILLGAKCDQSFINEQLIDIQASMPYAVEIKIVNLYPNADSRRSIHLETETIKDNYGNVIEDGTLVNFIVKEKKLKIAEYNSFTVNGISNVLIQNPNKAANWEVSAKLYGSLISNSIQLGFQDFINDFEYVFEKENRLIKAGPISNTLGQLATDGTEAVLIIDQNSTLVLQKETVDGYAVFHIPFGIDLDQKFKARLEIGGIIKEINK